MFILLPLRIHILVITSILRLTQSHPCFKVNLNDEYLFRVSNFDSDFVVWNTIVSLGEQKQYYAGSDSDDGSNTYMVQGDNPLEVNFESELDEDVDMSYDELASVGPKAFHPSFDDD